MTAVPSDRDTARTVFAEAVRVFHAGDRARALAMTEYALQLDPGYADAALEYARVLDGAGQRDAAEAVLRRAIGTTPADFRLLTNLGVLLCKLGRTAEGVERLRHAATLRPEMPQAWDNLGMALKAHGELDQALAAYRTALERRPDYADAYLHLGNCLAELDRLDEATAAYAEYGRRRRGPQSPPIPGDETLNRTNAAKLRHDVEQIDYLVARGALGPEGPGLLAAYRAALAALPDPEGGSAIVDLPVEHRAALAPTYNRLWHHRPAPALPGGALNPDVDWAGVAAAYERQRPGIVHVDGFLRPEALAALRAFCLDSTMWFRFRPNGGYVGAYWEQGFWCPLLRQIADGLRQAMPAVFGRHPLLKAWAYKYDSRLEGIGAHADFAAVNVNFWITPDAANLDPERGGLVVWDQEPPGDWEFAKYNADQPAIRAFLRDSGARSVRIPHRQNRVVIFNSNLFHETDGVAFAEGYENRRINITMLYGKGRAAT